MITLISILSCIAIMAVGVYAATSNFSISITNQVSIEFTHVDGELYGKRYGDVIYGEESMGDEGFSNVGTTFDEMDATLDDFILLYGNITNVGYTEHAGNMTEIKKPVNFYLSAKDPDDNIKNSLTIHYVFKFVFNPESPSNVKITLSNNSTELNDKRASNVSMSYKYCFSETEPTDWFAESTSIKSFGVDNSGTKTINVENLNTDTYIVYIYASMTVLRTDTLASAYTLGMGNEDFHWKFSISLVGEAL